jgi:sterol desaturase/sphingolipid hydroxylase (fatty acid hydroxylase superfamily)
MTYFALIFLFAAAFIVSERVFPGRTLPRVPGWYARVVLLNVCQLGIVILAGYTWNQWLVGWSLLAIAGNMDPLVEGLLGWFVGTFVFYWWHRLRHANRACWNVFHQIHHSPARIETLTSFYKHPVEIWANSVLTATILYVLLGASLEAAAWYNLFAAAGEMFYHSNLRTPHWVGYFMQRPEHHSIHHQLDVHDFNFGDITWWDRMFGTFKDTDAFTAHCGFPRNNERLLGSMLVCRDVYDR